MTDTEATLLLNQANILTALALLIPQPLSNMMQERAEVTIKYVKENYDLGQSTKI